MDRDCREGERLAGSTSLVELCVKALPPLVVRRGSIKDVSSHENGVDVPMFREVENSPDDIKARPRHAQLLFRRQPREPPTEVQRQALDALDTLRRGDDGANGNGKPPNGAEIATIVEVADDFTSQSRHSLVLRGSPPAGKLLIPLERRDVRVVEGARLESDFGDAHRATPKHFFAQSIQPLAAQDVSRCDAVSAGVHRRFVAHLTQFLHTSCFHLPVFAGVFLSTPQSQKSPLSDRSAIRSRPRSVG